MVATDFEFNGVKASDVNLAIVDFDSPSREGVVSSGGKTTFNTSKPANSKKWNFHGSHYEEQLSFSFQVGRINLNRRPQEVLPATSYEKAYYMRWLCRKDGYKYLRFLQNGYENIFYNAKIDLEWIDYGGCTYGAELTVTCDAPFGYSPLQSYEARVPSGNSFTIILHSAVTSPSSALAITFVGAALSLIPILLAVAFFMIMLIINLVYIIINLLTRN